MGRRYFSTISKEASLVCSWKIVFINYFWKFLRVRNLGSYSSANPSFCLYLYFGYFICKAITHSLLYYFDKQFFLFFFYLCSFLISKLFQSELSRYHVISATSCHCTVWHCYVSIKVLVFSVSYETFWERLETVAAPALKEIMQRIKLNVLRRESVLKESQILMVMNKPRCKLDANQNSLVLQAFLASTRMSWRIVGF